MQYAGFMRQGLPGRGHLCRRAHRRRRRRGLPGYLRGAPAPAADARGSARGIFVCIDGPGGVGKSTTARLVREELAARGMQVHATAEPSRTPLGEMIRASTDTYRGMALACLVAGDRHHHLATEIRPRLQAGFTVISDRYLPSSLVLQRMDGVDQETIWQLNKGAQPPDLAVILNATPAVLSGRLAARPFS